MQDARTVRALLQCLRLLVHMCTAHPTRHTRRPATAGHTGWSGVVGCVWRGGGEGWYRCTRTHVPMFPAWRTNRAARGTFRSEPARVTHHTVGSPPWADATSVQQPVVVVAVVVAVAAVADVMPLRRSGVRTRIWISRR